MAATTAAVVGAVAAVGGAVSQKKAADEATEAAERQGQAAIASQEGALARQQELLEPFRQLGLSVQNPLLDVLGLQRTEAGTAVQGQIDQVNSNIDSTRATIADFERRAATGTPAQKINAQEALVNLRGSLSRQEDRLGVLQADLSRAGFETFDQGGLTPEQFGAGAPDLPTAFTGQNLEEFNSIIDFLRQEGFEGIEESAAARGRLGAGGTLKDLTEFNVGLASTVAPALQAQQFGQQLGLRQQALGEQLQAEDIRRSGEAQKFNQLFNILGLGANVAAGQGTAQLSTAGNISNILGGIGAAQGAGAINQSNALTGGLQNLAGIAGAFSANQGGGQPVQQVQSPPPQTIPQQPVLFSA